VEFLKIALGFSGAGIIYNVRTGHVVHLVGPGVLPQERNNLGL